MRHPSKCKLNCPACARVCPQVAIIFPKYGAAPINGEEVREEDLRRQKMKVDVSALIQADIYQVLRSRGGGSPAPEELDPAKALQEREECSCASGEIGTVIPGAELLSSPALKQIRSRAEEAQEASEGQDGGPAGRGEPDEKEGDGSG